MAYYLNTQLTALTLQTASFYYLHNYKFFISHIIQEVKYEVSFNINTLNCLESMISFTTFYSEKNYLTSACHLKLITYTHLGTKPQRNSWKRIC